jgi:hypothetical protein
MTYKGEHAQPMAVAMYGHREVVLESTDDTDLWGPGHAEWKCLACGLTAQKSADLQRRACTP